MGRRAPRISPFRRILTGLAIRALSRLAPRPLRPFLRVLGMAQMIRGTMRDGRPEARRVPAKPYRKGQAWREAEEYGEKVLDRVGGRGSAAPPPSTTPPPPDAPKPASPAPAPSPPAAPPPAAMPVGIPWTPPAGAPAPPRAPYVNWKRLETPERKAERLAREDPAKLWAERRAEDAAEAARAAAESAPPSPAPPPRAPRPAPSPRVPSAGRPTTPKGQTAPRPGGRAEEPTSPRSPSAPPRVPAVPRSPRVPRGAGTSPLLERRRLPARGARGRARAGAGRNPDRGPAAGPFADPGARRPEGRRGGGSGRGRGGEEEESIEAAEATRPRRRVPEALRAKERKEQAVEERRKEDRPPLRVPGPERAAEREEGAEDQAEEEQAVEGRPAPRRVPEALRREEREEERADEADEAEAERAPPTRKAPPSRRVPPLRGAEGDEAGPGRREESGAAGREWPEKDEGKAASPERPGRLRAHNKASPDAGDAGPAGEAAEDVASDETTLLLREMAGTLRDILAAVKHEGRPGGEAAAAGGDAAKAAAPAAEGLPEGGGGKKEGAGLVETAVRGVVLLSEIAGAFL